MTSANSSVRALRWALVGIGLMLPVLSLVPLGSLWLWQNGYLIPWAIAACASTVIAWATQRWLLGTVATGEASGVSGSATTTPGDTTWTPAETAAWAKVQEIAALVVPDTLGSQEALLELGQRTLETVARSLHPDHKDPLLKFTAPEALALIERVAGRLDTFVRESVPLGDRLTLAQLMTLYRWRGSIEIAEQAWGVWRALRVLNPASALANEVRERVSKELVTWGKTHIARKLATVYVEEVGRAAIDLYGGRLRFAPDRVAGHITAASVRDLATASQSNGEPLRLLVAGQVSAGKSSLINALGEEVRAAVDALPATARFTPYRLTRAGLPAALIIDSPGLTPGNSQIKALIAEMERADLVLWVAPANRADREIDRAALTAFRAHFTDHPNRIAPPVLLVLTHVDQLRPFQDWAPPYNLNDPVSAKAASMRAAVEAAATDLGFDTDDVIPCALAATHDRYNVDAVWAAVSQRLPEAQRANLVRKLRDAEGTWDWQRLWSQAKTGGRVLARSLRQ